MANEGRRCSFRLASSLCRVNKAQKRGSYWYWLGLRADAHNDMLLVRVSPAKKIKEEERIGALGNYLGTCESTATRRYFMHAINEVGEASSVSAPRRHGMATVEEKRPHTLTLFCQKWFSICGGITASGRKASESQD